MKITIDHNKKAIAFVYFVFFIIVLFIHMPMGYISDDAVIAPTVANNSLEEFFVMRYNSNGRFMTDVLANFFYRIPMGIWKVFDSVVYTVIVFLVSQIFTRKTFIETITVCALVLAYPFEYLKSAGYIATTANYVYPVAAILLIAFSFKMMSDKKKVPVPYYIVSLISIVYATNHDQYAVVLIGGLIFYLIYSLVNNSDKTLIISITAHLVMSVCSYIFVFFSPGHIKRMNNTSEMLRWLPQFENWTTFQKIYQGFSTTAGNLFFNNVALFTVFCVLLFVISLFRKNIQEKLFAAVPIGVILLSNVFGSEKFITTYNFSCGMPELCPTNSGINGFLALFFSVTAVLMIFISVYNCVSDRKNRWAIMVLLALAAISREMMGFSATLYASSFRTFTFFVYAMLACCLILLNDIKMQMGEENEVTKYIGLVIGVFALAL